MYRFRYRALEAGTTPRNVAACFLFLLGSYVVSALVNASTVTKPALSAPRRQTIIVAPRNVPAAEVPEIPAPEPGSALEAELSAPTHRL